MERKIYFVDEGTVNNETMQNEKFNTSNYKKILEDKVNSYAEIWYFHNSTVKGIFTEDEFINLAKKSSCFICKADGKDIYSINYRIVKQILFKEDEEKNYVYDKMWKEFVNGIVAYMKVQTKKILDELNGEVI